MAEQCSQDHGAVVVQAAMPHVILQIEKLLVPLVEWLDGLAALAVEPPAYPASVKPITQSPAPSATLTSTPVNTLANGWLASSFLQGRKIPPSGPLALGVILDCIPQFIAIITTVGQHI